MNPLRTWWRRLWLKRQPWAILDDFFPNLLTALVAAMGLALSAVVLLLVRDNRRRLRAEFESLRKQK